MGPLRNCEDSVAVLKGSTYAGTLKRVGFISVHFWSISKSEFIIWHFNFPGSTVWDQVTSWPELLLRSYRDPVQQANLQAHLEAPFSA